MGKEQSKNILPVETGTAIEVTDHYVLRPGLLPNGNVCSVFSGSPSNPLRTLAQNLKTHRHPRIVRYISSGEHNGHLYVVTEEVKPLFLTLKEQSALQICVGLHGLISALTFLHKQAETSHNNVCCASVFVTPEGTWKLGGLEFMTKFAGTTSQTLQDLSPRRYQTAIPPEEKGGRIYAPAIDIYGLGVLVNELLAQQSDADIPHMEQMLEFSKSRLLSVEPRNRASMSDVVTHPFFCHEFIKIHQFLFELPLKGAEEKLEFFRELEQRLRNLPKDMLASQLVPLLLARVVVLEPAAQQHLLPILLRPVSDDDQDGPLLSKDLFRRYVVPKLLQMFCVRDISVRLLLLTYLQGFLHCFTTDQLHQQLLPELLVGVKDENDTLVAATLHALATLVGVLGGSAVVGARRARLFSDGRPATRRPRPEAALPERPSPDGGEDSIAEDTETWSDWEEPSAKTVSDITPISGEELIKTQEVTPRESLSNLKKPPRDIPPPTITINLADIEALDVKNSAGWKFNAGPDFFSDMEPVISKTQMAPVLIEDKFKVRDTEVIGAAWDSFEEWGDVNT